MRKKKYYAVVEGRRPGLYDEWIGAEGAEAQIKGFSGAVYKSFRSFKEAEAWFVKIAGCPPTYSSTSVVQADLLFSTVQHSTAEISAQHEDIATEGRVIMYTDGACEGNPGPGGYGVVLLYKQHRKELCGGFLLTTNNRMELIACIVGLQVLKRKSVVVVYSDSTYVVNGIQLGWAEKWRANQWKRRDRGEERDVKNADLWQQLLELCEYHDVEFAWVKGHAGVDENERCDQLSVQASRQRNLPPDVGFEATFAERDYSTG